MAMARRVMLAAARSFRAPTRFAIRMPVRPLCAAVQTFLEKAEVSERVMQVLKNFEKVEDAKVAAGAHFEKDLGLDSLDAVEVCMALEEEFCIQIPDAEAESIKTVDDAVEFVSTHPQAK